MRADLRGMLAVAATYIFFLLYAQFGFLALAQRISTATEQVEAIMLAMGLSGFLASLATAAVLRRRSPRSLLQVGFIGCSLTAASAALVGSIESLMLIATLIGLFTGLLTVALATGLRQLVGGSGFGLKVGAATGAAYFFCNIPSIFEATPATQGAIATLVCVIGLAAVSLPAPAARFERVTPARPALTLRDFGLAGFVCVVVWFLALIWLDSAAFAIIQQTPELKVHTWAGVPQKWLLGFLHLGAATLAGHLIDRGRFFSLLLSAFLLFVAAFTLLDRASELLRLASPIYVVGISLYSVALVVYPSYRPALRGLVPPRWRAGALFGVGGWIGSALGIGMVQDLHRVPGVFLLATGGALIAGRMLTRGFGPWRFLRVYRSTLGFGIAAVALLVVPPGPSDGATPTVTPGSPADPAVRRGRGVYIQEGCINCHSQFVRTGTEDVELWGPRREIDPEEQPPLIGMRRQGPDLMNVGNRRSGEWHRLHLISPRQVSPGSRMPSYAHLFAVDDTRGDDLIAYLSSLGADTSLERYRFTQAFRLPEAEPGSVRNGARLFGEFCANCHGAGARGDGPIGRELRRPAMDLLKKDFWLISWGPGTESEDRALARVVKFGVPGTTMAGHETLSSQGIADVVAYLQQLRQTGERWAKGPQ